MKIDENKIAYCRKLYLEQQGRDHKLIEKWMHEAGHSFSVRSLYYSKGRPGWIEKYGWKRVLSDERHAVTRLAASLPPPAQRGVRWSSVTSAGAAPRRPRPQ